MQLTSALEYRALEAQVRELHRLLGKKARQNELLREDIFRAAGAKTAAALDLVAGRWSVTAVADALGIARPHLSAMRNRSPPRPHGRPPLPDAELVADIHRLTADLPAYGYRRVHALLRGQAEKTRRTSPTASACTAS